MNNSKIVYSTARGLLKHKSIKKHSQTFSFIIRVSNLENYNLISD